MEEETDQPRKRLTAAARRQMILDAARDVFLESGLNGARLRDIADRVGITEAYLYRHFASKADLYEAAVHEPVRQATEAFSQRLEALVSRMTACRKKIPSDVERKVFCASELSGSHSGAVTLDCRTNFSVRT